MDLTAAEEFGELRNVIPGVLQNEACEITSDASRIELGQDLGAILVISMLIAIEPEQGNKKHESHFFTSRIFKMGTSANYSKWRRFCLSDRKRWFDVIYIPGFIERGVGLAAR